MTSKVTILLPTYNGEKYIEEQLKSIWNQDYSNIEVIIRDDGSTDNTISLIRKNIIGKPAKLIEGDNIGVIEGFFQLLSEIDEDTAYIALCDQDDVWNPDKIRLAVDALEKQMRGMPLLYCSAVQPVNEMLIPITAGLHYRQIIPAFGNALVENICTGCTAVFNRELYELMKNRKPEFVVMHDFWIYLVASCFGTVIYDKEPHIQYRQHASNQVGMASTRIENYIRRINNYTKHRGQLLRQANELIRLYNLEGENRRLINEFVQIRSSFKKRVAIISNKKVYRQRKIDSWILKGLILFGKV